MSDDITPEGWPQWRRLTPARIGLGRVGSGLPTSQTLAFGLAHAMARDAIHAPLDVGRLAAELEADGWRGVTSVKSQAPDRVTYLRRPDLGRLLDDADGIALATASAPVDCCFVLGDGLSSLALQRHAVPFLRAAREALDGEFSLAPPVIATQARVALGDAVGAALKARLVVVLIGERPGLSSPDSLGLYITYAPRVGLSDAARTGVSNVRPEGLDYGAAAFKMGWLVRQALALGLTGVGLKDESDEAMGGGVLS